ncbi:MAG TPA: hypothetical protein VIS48_05470 [Candidatus Kryptonia bacterium]
MATKYPPALSFSEALVVIKKMKVDHGNETSVELMPKVLNISPNSSYLPRKIAALQAFGLVEKTPSDDLALTELALQIIKPIGDEDKEAILKAFQKNDVLSDLWNKYSDGKLPSAEQTQQILMKNYQIPRETVKQWYEFVIDSFRAIGGVQTEDWLKEANAVLDARTPLRQHYQNFLLPTGSKFEFSLPDNVTIDDFDFIIGFFELKKKTISKNAVTK